MSHTHTHKALVLVRVTASNPAYTGEPMAMLARKCDCGSKQAFEYGPRYTMMHLGKILKSREK
jgi:hypothetical protein